MSTPFGTDITDGTTYPDGLHGTVINYGKQSQVELLEREYLKVPIIIKWIGVGKRLTYKEVTDLYIHLVDYRDILERNGWDVPRLHEVIIYKDKRAACMSVYEEYITGQRIDEIIKDSRTVRRTWELFASLFLLLARQETIAVTMGNQQLHRLSYGVDLKPSNLVIDSAGKVYLVDTFGPKVIKPSGQWAAYSKKLEGIGKEPLMAVTATREGILLRFLRLVGIEDAKNATIQRLWDCLHEAGIPPSEVKFVIDEVKNGYPWLDYLYGKSS